MVGFVIVRSIDMFRCKEESVIVTKPIYPDPLLGHTQEQQCGLFDDQIDSHVHSGSFCNSYVAFSMFRITESCTLGIFVTSRQTLLTIPPSTGITRPFTNEA